MTPPTVVVTGASRGIGAAVARALAPDHRLVLLGRDRAALDAVARDCAGPGDRPGVLVVPLELTDHDAVARCPELAGLERVDGLVHSAGVATAARLEDTPVSAWREAFEVNVLAVVVLTHALLPALRAAGGHFVAVNSGAGHTAKPARGSYSASKFALRAYTDTLRQEEPALRVTSVHPGRVDTDMQRALVAAESGEYRADEYLRPESVADAVRAALLSAPDAHPTELVLRPRRG